MRGAAAALPMHARAERAVAIREKVNATMSSASKEVGAELGRARAEAFSMKLESFYTLATRYLES